MKNEKRYTIQITDSLDFILWRGCAVASSKKEANGIANKIKKSLTGKNLTASVY